MTDSEPPISHDHTHVVHNGKRAMTIDQLADSQPGMDRLMAEVGPRMHRLYYAASAGNWRLATYFYNSVVKQLQLSAFSRPKYEVEMAAYVEQDCEPVRLALRDRDSSGFATAYAAMVDRGNYYHGVFNKPYIAWKTPTSPPEDLDLTAGMGDAEA